jgi:hypothetical protein
MSKKAHSVSLQYVIWNDGKPRFHPTKQLLTAGFKGRNLRHDNGQWFTYEQVKAYMENIYRQVHRMRMEDKPDEAIIAPPKSHRFTVGEAVRAVFQTESFVGGDAAAQKLAMKRFIRPATKAMYQWLADKLEDDMPDIWACDASLITVDIARKITGDFLKRRGRSAALQFRALMSNAWKASPRLADHSDPEGRSIWYRFPMSMPDPRVRVGSIAEIERLVAVADHLKRPDLGDMIVLAVTTGQRQGDRLAMMQNQRMASPINNKPIIKVKQRKRENDDKPVTVYVPEWDWLAERLAAAQQRRLLHKVHYQEVCINEAEPAPWGKSFYSHSFTRLREQAVKGIADKFEPMPSLADFTDQDLRDTAVTWLVRMGCEIPEICAVTGHTLASATTILRHYMGSDPEITENVRGKVEAWVERHEKKSGRSFGKSSL